MQAERPETTTVFIDLETGGLEPEHPIIQVAAVAIDDWTWEEREAIELKIRFDQDKCDPKALTLNSYDPEVWERDACWNHVAQSKLEAFFKRHQTWELISAKGNPYRTARIAGHNIAQFDAPRLHAWWGDRFAPFAWWYPLDTIQLAFWHVRGLRPEASPPPPNYQLGTLCDRYCIDRTDAHDALADVRATVKLAEILTGAKPAKWI